MRSLILRRLLVLLLGLSPLCAVAEGDVEDAREFGDRRDPYFGEALYHAYQGDYFEALERLDSELAQHYGVDERDLDSLFPQIDDAEFSVGDFELRYRMHQRAGRAIRAVLEGDVAESVELLEEVLRIDPTFADAYEAVGVIFGRSGKFHEAIDVFQRLAEVVPDEPMVDTNLSLYFMKLGDKARAEDYSAKALQKNMAKAAGSSVTAAAMAASQSQQRKNDALRKKGMFEQVLAFDPEDSIALFGAGNALFVLEDWEGAADYLQRASAADKNNAAVFLAHGKALEKLERGDEALAVFKAGMDVASRRGDLMPLNEMVQRVLLLEAMNS